MIAYFVNTIARIKLSPTCVGLGQEMQKHVSQQRTDGEREELAKCLGGLAVFFPQGGAGLKWNEEKGSDARTADQQRRDEREEKRIRWRVGVVIGKSA